MNVKDMLDGMNLLMNYYLDSTGCNVEAEHNVLYMKATDRPLTPQDLAKMIELGWHQEHNDHNEDFSPAVYRLDQSWVAYV